MYIIYTIRPLFKLLLLMIPALWGTLVVANYMWKRQTLQIKEGLQRFRKRLPLILFTAILGSALCMTYFITGEPYSSSVKMSYTYPKASKGLTPNNTTLDVSEALSNEVLESVVESGELGNLSADELKNTLSIRNVKQRGSVSADDLYVSTEYSISYYASEKTASVDKDKILKAVTDAYYDHFEEQYGRRTDVLEGDFSEVSELDYLDVHTYLNSRIDTVIDYMKMCSKENSTYVSEATQESFSSVRDKAQNFKDVSLERYESYVLKYGLSKDNAQYISRLNHENRIENVEYLKNLAAYRVRIAAIARYDGDITRAVLVPTRDESGEFYQSRTKIGTDYFAAEANKHLTYATTNQLNIETNNYHIESLSTPAESASYRQEADKMVEELKNEITSITAQAIETIREYDRETSKGYISFAFQDENANTRSHIKRTIYYGGGVFVILSAAVITNSDLLLKRKKKSKLKVVEGAEHK
ncbi:MAG: hypothetical protein HFJ10_01095 [Lachnospiraceae bacterium]|nr:hypothetical protein [Lachnospiraceae bacterium]